MEYSALPQPRCTRCMPGFWLSSGPATGSTTCVKVCCACCCSSAARRAQGYHSLFLRPRVPQCPPVPGCAGWAGSAAKPEECICAACQERFALAGGACTPCSQVQCSRCSPANPGVCWECLPGWSPLGGACQRCTATACSRCELDAGGQRCTACNPGFFLDNTGLLPRCAPCDDTVGRGVRHAVQRSTQAPLLPLLRRSQNAPCPARPAELR